MNNPSAQPSSPLASRLSLGDVYYAIFRHKWKILACSATGFLAAAAFYRFQPPPFESEARLFIRYIMEGKTVGPGSDEARLKTPDQRGETIIASELQILTSLDLAGQVAAAIGPTRILGESTGIDDRSRAAYAIRAGLTAEIPLKSSVVRIAFQHHDPELVVPVLRELINRYLKRHVEVHQSAGLVGNFLVQETDQLRSRLAQTEDELRKVRIKAGVISLEDAKKAYGDQIARLREDVFRAQAELAERSGAMKAMQRPIPAVDSPDSEKDVAATMPPPAVVAEYQRVFATVQTLNKREQELLTRFTGENRILQDLRVQIADAEKARLEFESAHPTLVARTSQVTGDQASTVLDPSSQAVHIAAIQTRLVVLNRQLEAVKAEVAALNEVEGSVLELQRKKDLEESNYRYLAASLEQARFTEALSAGRVSNISLIQEPSPPYVVTTKFLKIVMGLVFGGVAAGIGWALLIEMYLDRSLRRPAEVERRTGIPLFLSIPAIRKRVNGKAHRPAVATPSPALPASSAAPVADGSHLATWVDDPALHPFHEALRDRLFGYFESRNLTHKPKLVAVTGIAPDAGVTTLAAGIAACMSETADGNVLLVDMTSGQGSAQQFYRGRPVCDLDQALEAPGTTQIQDKLFVVGEGSNGDRLSRALPQRFTKVLPKLRASDFDYIIFDMPVINQISITPRLAGFMDIVLLVIESEKTDRALVERARDLLAESKAYVGVVLNKTRVYVPRRLHQEVLSEN